MADIRGALDSIEHLAPFPKIVQRILDITNDETSSAKDLSRCIKEDMSLTARILRIVNSAYYGFSRTIGNIEHAIVILGFNEVVNIAMALILTRQYPGGRNTLLDKEQFWMHSVCTGYMARTLSKQVRSISAEDAFVAGLLHDIGKVVLDQFFPEELEQALQYARENKVSLRQASLKLLDIDHTEVGTRVAEHWELPLTLVQAIQYHHDPEHAPEDRLMPYVAHVANGMVHNKKVGDSGNPVPDSISQVALEKLHLADTSLDDVWEAAKLDDVDLKIFM